MAGYTRQDITGNIADGNVIDADDLNAEFDQVENAFVAATGHKHDGTAGEGAPIEKVGPAQEVVVTATTIQPKTDALISLGTSSVEFNNAYFDGTVKTDVLTVDETSTFTGNATFNANVTLGNAATDTVTFTADVASNILPSANNTYDLGATGSEWKDLYIDGVAYVDSIAMPTTTVTDILDEDDLTSDSATALATQQSIKAYVDAQVTAQDLDLSGDTGTIAIDLDSETLTIAGGTGLTSSASANTLTLNIDSTVATLTGTQTLTNKTLTSPDINTPDIDGGTIDGTVIGASTAAAITGTTITGTSLVGPLTGNVTGNVTGDVTGDLTGDLVGTATTAKDFNPATDSTYNLGTSAIRWANIYSDAANITSITGDLIGNADTATTWETSRTITLTGDVTGSVSGVNGSGNISIATTVAANSVALGTDTTGNYVSSLVAGTGVTLSNNTGESATPTVAIGQSVGTTDNVTFGTVTADSFTVSGGAVIAGASEFADLSVSNSLSFTEGTQDWTIEVDTADGDAVVVKYNNVALFKLDTSGNATFAGNVDSNGTL